MTLQAAGKRWAAQGGPWGALRSMARQRSTRRRDGQYGEADIELVGELELLGDQLTPDEIAVACTYLDEYEQYDEMEYEDAEWTMN